MAGDENNDERHKDDLQDVAVQVYVTDATTKMSNLLDGTLFGGILRRGRSDFEGYELNSLLDMVRQTKPEDLENAGKALWNARDAIKDAAEELSGHIDRVEWVGESGEAFRTWGKKLVNHTRKLSAFAEVAGDQITAAGTGLASVISALPERDTRIDPKSVEDIPAPKRVESNDEYAAAVKTEKNRQEAINQMNRLASFYAVSSETLAAQEAPTFESMPDVGVPEPDPSDGRGRLTLGEDGGTLSAAGDSGTTAHHSTSRPGGESGTGGTTVPYKDVDGSITYPDRNVGTKIDSVDTLPPQTTSPSTGTPPSAPNSPGTGGGTIPPFANGAAYRVPNGPAGRASRAGGGGRTPVSAQGRSGNPSGASQAPLGRGPTGPMGRSSSTGQSGVRGGPTASSGTPMGRGVSGGTPRVSGPAGGRTGGPGVTGAGRGTGVVGGRPTAGPSAGATGSTAQRGTVVGGESTAGSRNAAGSLGQRGVIGAPNSTPPTGTRETARRSTGNPDGVLGAPKGRSAARTSGFTSGGTGLVRGPGNQQEPDPQSAEGTRQPEAPVADDETHLPDNQRRNVPPVIG